MSTKSQPSHILLETLKQWTEAKTALDAFKILEASLREKLVKEAFPDKKKLAEGTFKYDLPHGWQLSMAAKVNVTIDEAVLDSTFEALREAGMKPEDIFGSKATFIKAGYKALDAQGKKLVESALTFKDGSLTLDLIAPKQKA